MFCVPTHTIAGTLLTTPVSPPVSSRLGVRGCSRLSVACDFARARALRTYVGGYPLIVTRIKIHTGTTTDSH